MEWAKDTYNKQYESWMPWVEDIYLRYFTKDNKVSYTAKRTPILLLSSSTHCQLTDPIAENLDKTKVTGIGPVDNLQDGVNGLATGQLGQGGLLQPVTDKTSKEGVNRAERQGKDDKGSYVPSSIPGGEAASNAVGGAAEGGKSVASSVGSGLKGAGGYIGSAFGGGNKTEGEQQK